MKNYRKSISNISIYNQRCQYRKRTHIFCTLKIPYKRTDNLLENTTYNKTMVGNLTLHFIASITIYTSHIHWQKGTF